MLSISQRTVKKAAILTFINDMDEIIDQVAEEEVELEADAELKKETSDARSRPKTATKPVSKGHHRKG